MSQRESMQNGGVYPPQIQVNTATPVVSTYENLYFMTSWKNQFAANTDGFSNTHAESVTKLKVSQALPYWSNVSWVTFDQPMVIGDININLFTAKHFEL